MRGTDPTKSKWVCLKKWQFFVFNSKKKVFKPNFGLQLSIITNSLVLI